MSSPAYSAGARYERDAVRDYLRRKLRNALNGVEQAILDSALQWILKRQDRYGKQKGGLGK